MEGERAELSGSSLQSSLEALVARWDLGRIEVAAWERGCTFRAAAGSAGHTPDSHDAGMFTTAAGCLTKLLTATLVAHGCAQGRLNLEDSVAGLLAGSAVGDDCLPTFQGIRIRDLLNHTHGIDGSHLDETPAVLANGMLDARGLCQRLCQFPPATKVGAYFDYGSAGSWLTAVILENSYAKAYPALLQEKLFQPLGIRAFVGDIALERYSSEIGAVQANTRVAEPACSGKSPLRCADVCPASGHRLRLSVEDLLSLARQHLCTQTPQGAAEIRLNEAILSLRGHPFKPPGWLGARREICLGYSEFGDGWYGHNSVMFEQSAVVRFCPARDCAIAIAAEQDVAAYLALAALFGRMLPEFSEKRVPRMMRPEEWARVDALPYVGCYENAAWVISIELTSERSLRARVFRKDAPAPSSDEPYVKRHLRAAHGALFFAEPPEPLIVPFVQFLEPVGGRGFGYLHNGRQIFVRHPVMSR